MRHMLESRHFRLLGRRLNQMQEGITKKLIMGNSRNQ